MVEFLLAFESSENPLTSTLTHQELVEEFLHDIASTIAGELGMDVNPIAFYIDSRTIGDEEGAP